MKVLPDMLEEIIPLIIEKSQTLINAKFTPTTKGNILNSKSDIFNLTRRLQVEEILHEKEFNDESIVYNKSKKHLKLKI